MNATIGKPATRYIGYLLGRPDRPNIWIECGWTDEGDPAMRMVKADPGDETRWMEANREETR